MDGFLVKKIVSMLVQLIPAVPLLMLLVCLFFKRPGRKLLILGSLVLLAAASPVISNVVVGTLEKQHAVVREAPADTALILVLGSGHNPAGVRPPNSVLDVNSLSRLMEGVRLWQGQRDASLVVTSGQIKQGQTHAESMASMAVTLGVPDDKIHMLTTARDTEDELVLAAELLETMKTEEKSRLLVVSTALHLPRAAKMLQPLNVTSTLAPTDYLAKPERWYRFNALYLWHTERAIHEYVGMLWLAVRPWFAEYL